MFVFDSSMMQAKQAIIGIAISAVLLGSLFAWMPQANADRTAISMEIVNTKYDTTKVIELAKIYTYGQRINVDVSDTQLSKIDMIFGKTSFLFDLSEDSHEADHHPWNVSISMPVQAGRQLIVQFV